MQQFKDAYHDLARGTFAANDTAARGIGYLRAGSIGSRLGGRVMTTIVNLTGLFQASTVVGHQYMAKAFIYMLSHPHEWKRIHDAIEPV